MQPHTSPIMVSEDRQQYIPTSRARVKEKLFQLEGLSEETITGLGRVCEMLEAIWHHSSHAGLEGLKSLYEDMDPDQIATPSTEGSDEFLRVFTEALKDGNWEDISDAELQDALEGEDVFPISLDVRFDEFKTMRLFKLGEMTIEDVRKSWFGLKEELISTDSYDRVIQIIEFHDEDWFRERKRMKHYPGAEAKGLHIRLFKTVPKLDLETVFPNTTPMMRIVDKIKIGVPLVGGLVTLGMKFGPALFGAEAGDTSLALIGGLTSALGTYILKSYLKYTKTKEQYLSQVSKDLYFKGQANNAAVLNMVVDLAEEQEVKEALLAYAFIHLDGGGRHDEDSLDTRVEAWLLEATGMDIDFEVDDGLAKLDLMGLLQKDGEGRLSVTSIEQTLTILDEHWDNIYDY